MSIFFIMQTVEENYKWAVPLIVSNFITILLIFFFTKDRSQQQITYQEKIALSWIKKTKNIFVT